MWTAAIWLVWAWLACRWEITSANGSLDWRHGPVFEGWVSLLPTAAAVALTLWVNR